MEYLKNLKYEKAKPNVLRDCQMFSQRDLSDSGGSILYHACSPTSTKQHSLVCGCCMQEVCAGNYVIVVVARKIDTGKYSSMSSSLEFWC